MTKKLTKSKSLLKLTCMCYDFCTRLIDGDFIFYQKEKSLLVYFLVCLYLPSYVVFLICTILYFLIFIYYTINKYMFINIQYYTTNENVGLLITKGWCFG